MTHTRSDCWRHISENGCETIKVEDWIADRVLIDAQVAVADPVTFDQSFERLGLKATQCSSRLLYKTRNFPLISLL